MEDLDPSQLSTRLHEILSSFIYLSTHVEDRIKLLREKENHHEETKKKMGESIMRAENQIDLNVGGMRLSASKSTLVSIEGSYFHVMLSSDRWKPDNKGEYFIDRDFTHFPRILNYLRTGELQLDGLSEIEVQRLNQELDYYQIPRAYEQPPVHSVFYAPPVTSFHSVKPLRWDPNRKGTAITISENGKTAKNGVTIFTTGTVLGTRSVPSFSIRILSHGSTGPFLGLAPQTFNVHKENLCSSGWCLNLYHGTLFSQAGDNVRPYANRIKKESIVTVSYTHLTLPTT
eukprot:TRINITY_DN4266_c0_g1_i2.p1 TRINITY_DN4266_c0_g1~~TRINITY_DN4266_c0_g1_i2.p1  ORF type:complete len:287 (-),score=54.49 TRINITY_DN4266_c0_g1_i2:23-883(-)